MKPILSAVRHINSQTIFPLLITCYLLIACIIAPFNLLAFDTYYYWDWSRHLDFSYYDGPPVIAYIIRLLTWLTGHALYGLTFLALVITALTAWVLYKTATLFLEKTASYVATAWWLFSPLVTQDLLVQLTYDTPMTFFWALSLYYAVLYIKKKQVKTLYALGASLGFMLLSKYSGIVLVGALFTFVILTPYRRLLKNPHFYGALCLTALIFSPVLIWNVVHHGLSFNYQLHTHGAGSDHGLWLLLESFVTKFLPSLNVMLLVPFLINKRAKAYRDEMQLISMVSLFFLGFYLFISAIANLRSTWLVQYLLTSALLAGAIFQCTPSVVVRAKAHYQQRIISSMHRLFEPFWSLRLITLSAVISVGFLLNTCLHFVPSKNYIYYKLIQQFNVDYPVQPNIVFTSGWLEARMLFFMKSKPIIYTLGCNRAQNAYEYWSEPIVYAMKNKHLKTILFIDQDESNDCLRQYFSQCDRIPTTVISGQTLYVYRCTNASRI